MTIAVRGYTGPTSHGDGTISFPAGTQVGDLVIVLTQGYAPTSAPTVTSQPNGVAYTKYIESGGNSYYMTRMFWHVVQAGESSITFYAGGGSPQVAIVVISGVDPVSPIVTSGVSYIQGGDATHPIDQNDTYTFPTVTATRNGQAVLAAIDWSAGGTASNYQAVVTPFGTDLWGGSSPTLEMMFNQPYTNGAVITPSGVWHPGNSSNNYGGTGNFITTLIQPINNTPAVPTSVGPTGTLTNAKPLLQATVTDPDGGNVYAYFQVATDAGFSNVVFQGQGSTVTSGGTSTLYATGLNASTTYYVRAYASDSLVSSAYSTGVTFTTSAPITQTFTYTGGDQTFTWPTGIATVTIDSKGAGGGVGGQGAGPGGAGGRAACTVAGTPGEALTVRVGGAPAGGGNTGGWPGGGGSSSGINGNGGGYSGVFRGATPLNIAGAGGGSGATQYPTSGAGGAGGGTVGQDGGATSGKDGGKGGTQSAGGAGSSFGGNAGGYLVGGNANTWSGSGGAGYYGGGGGGDPYPSGDGSSGGGGSSYTTGTLVANTTGGGAPAQTNGTVVISYPNYATTTNNPPNAPALTTPAAAAVVPSGAVTFAWSFSDPDGGATQGGYVLRLIDPTGATVYWNASTGALQAGAAINATTSGTVILPAGVIYGGPWQFSVSTTDQFGLQGAFAANRAFTVAGGFSMMI